MQTARLLEIEDELHRKPKALSGGQRQRVAIGRAIIRRPKVFLFDEPLSNLDAKLRSQMRIELQKLHREINATMIYVTHDQTEAMTLGKPIVVPDEDGCMEAIGHGEFGFIYRQGDIEHLSAMTLEAISDRERCSKSRNRILEEYDWRVVMGKLDRIYAGASAP